MIQALICDWGGVLTTPLYQAFLHVQERHGVPIEAVGKALTRATEARGENPLFTIERGELTEAEFIAILAEGVSREVGREMPMESFADQYFAGIRTNDELIDYLRTVKARGVRMCLLTNNVREWDGRWRSMLPVDELFEFVVDSAFVGMRKPEAGIYALTLEKLGLPGGACAFLDDVDVNCEAARAFGINAVQFESTEQAIRDLEALLPAA